jgi:glyoxylase I family protein
MAETVRFYEGFLDIKVRRVVSDSPGHKHYSLDLGGEGTLDFFEAKPGTEASQREAIGALNHLAVTAEPSFIDQAERRLTAAEIPVRVVERMGQKTIYFSDPNGINLQLYPATGGSRA